MVKRPTDHDRALIARAVLEESRLYRQRLRWRADPVAYARERLGVEPTRDQAAILTALTVPPYRVLVPAANNTGKSHAAALAALWFYETRDPSATIITAPTDRQVRMVVFKEIRRMYQGGPGFLPKDPHCETAPWHVLKGFTAVGESSFQGVREKSTLVVFDEATGIDPEIWTGANYMLSGGDAGETLWLAILNPTDPASQAYLEEQTGLWTVVRLTAFGHPNIAAELDGRAAPVPAAVRLRALAENLVKYGEFPADDRSEPTDVDLYDPATYDLDEFTACQAASVAVAFPGRLWRPTTPEGDARILGRYPRQAAYSIFSDAAFDLAERLDRFDDRDAAGAATIAVGCDVARFGDDHTSIHVRVGRYSVHHETYRGQDTVFTAGRLRQLALAWGGRLGVPLHLVPLLIDDDGVGGGVTDLARAQGCRVVPVNGGSTARDGDAYPNSRSERLFDLAAALETGRVHFGDLPAAVRQALRRQAVGIRYKLDAAGRRSADPKETTKRDLKRSPDDLDACALAYYTPGGVGFLAGPPTAVPRVPRPDDRDRGDDACRAAPLPSFGRRIREHK